MSSVSLVDQSFITALDEAYSNSTLEFARAYYRFATAKLSDTYNSEEIYQKYPILSDGETFHKLKNAYDANPDDETIKRLFAASLESFVGNKLAQQSDAFENKRNQLKLDVSALGITDAEGQAVHELLYEDVSQYLKTLEDKDTRDKLYAIMAEGYERELAPLYRQLLDEEDRLMAELGYPDRVAFYSQMTGHDLKKLAGIGQTVVQETRPLYMPRMGTRYMQLTGEDFRESATRADIAYVLNGKQPFMEAIDDQFPSERMIEIATATFDELSLNFSTIAETVDFQADAEYHAKVVQFSEEHPDEKRILLDVAHRKGKRSRAYVYPAKVPCEIYLSVKPEGGLDDYSAFFHESGHAMHFAYTDPSLSFALSQLGNNTVTECYAYLFQNLFLNRHWLEYGAGLSAYEARLAVFRGALNDLYMLRRYASKMSFEVELFDGQGYDGKGERYAHFLTEGTGFRYDAGGWMRDVDAGFYVADYFTAWALEAQMREFLSKEFGDDDSNGEDWYTNPRAGEFLQLLWKDGNLNQHELSARLGYNDPTDVGPLLRLMEYNLEG